MADVSVDEAVKVAEGWLGLVDSGDYIASWDRAAEYFKNAIGCEDWKKSLHAHRKPLGECLSRKLTSSKYATSLPGAPDGEYVVIQFQTSFSRKKESVETITPMKEKDDQWRVSGYFIK